MATCGVCCDLLNKSTRKAVPCNTCDFQLCLKCFEQYQLDQSGLYEVSCMNCKQLWEDQHVLEHVPAAVVKRLTSGTKKRLREMEMSFMPETQMYVEYGRKVETVKFHEYLDIVRQQNEIRLELAKADITNTKAADRDRWNTQFNRLKSDLNFMKDHINRWRKHKLLSPSFRDIMPEELYNKTYAHMTAAETQAISNSRSSVSSLEESRVLCPCPQDNCRGFVFRGHPNKCGLCDHVLCGKCLQEKGENHECQEQDVQSAKAILESSKPCPKCAVRIHKIEGCDQMWCTQCNTPFSWNTGKEIRGSVIHNPHYYEWMRNNQPERQRPDMDMNVCEGLPEAYHLSRHLNVVFHKSHEFSQELRYIHRKCVHFQQIERRNVDVPVFGTNLNLRMRWLTNEISDKAFESGLHRKHKQLQINMRINQVFDLITTLCSDVFHRLLRVHTDSEEVRKQYQTEFKEIHSYANTRFMHLEKIYKVQMPRV